MTKLYLVAAAVAAITAGGAQAQTQDLRRNYLPNTSAELLELLQGCNEDSCMSYVAGVINGMDVYAFLTESPTPFCAGPEVKSEDVRAAIVKTIQKTPAMADTSAPAAVLAAFADNWPCHDQPDGSAEPVQEVATDLQYNDLSQIELDTLLDFIGQRSYAVQIGNAKAAIDRTLHVFNDPNCHYCAGTNSEIQKLVNQGWRVFIYPISTTDNASNGYAAVQLAIRDKHPEAALALHHYASEETKDITTALKIVQEAGVSQADALTLLASSNPYAVLNVNNKAFADFGMIDTPSWILGDRIGTGVIDAAEITRIQGGMTLTSPPANPALSNDLRPGIVVTQE